MTVAYCGIINGEIACLLDGKMTEKKKKISASDDKK